MQVVTIENTERPLVTFALFAYNQERFIREAAEAALAQTYSPLQVILSDDFSSDDTFKIIQQVAEDYTGPHEVIINCNKHNLGVGSHVNHIMKLAKGQLVIGGAGDDVSLPERAAELAKEWLRRDMRCSSLYSDLLMIGEDGQSLGIRDFAYPEVYSTSDAFRFAVDTMTRGVIGCVHAWDRRLFEVFGPMLSDTVYEDRVLAFRSLLLDGIGHIPQVLVKYRIHPGSITMTSRGTTTHAAINKLRTDLTRQRNVFLNYRKDLLTLESIGPLPVSCSPSTEKRSTLEHIEQKIREYDCHLLALEGGTQEKFRALSMLYKTTGSIGSAIRLAILAFYPAAWFAQSRSS